MSDCRHWSGWLLLMLFLISSTNGISNTTKTNKRIQQPRQQASSTALFTITRKPSAVPDDAIIIGTPSTSLLEVSNIDPFPVISSPSSSLSLFDVVSNNKAVNSSPAASLSLFDDNIIPPAGVVPRVVVNNAIPSAPVVVSTIVTNNNEFERQDGVSLFDLESGHSDSQNSPPFAPPVTSVFVSSNRRPTTPIPVLSLFNTNSQETRPSPPRLPNSPDDFGFAPPAPPEPTAPAPPDQFAPAPPPDQFAPPAVPISAIVSSDGQFNQVNLNWAQLQAMLTPSTDIGSIISSITSSGQSSSLRPRPPGIPVGATTNSGIFAPAPPVGPPSTGFPSPVGTIMGLLPTVAGTALNSLVPGAGTVFNALVPGVGSYLNSLRPGDVPLQQQQQQQQLYQQQVQQQPR